MLRTLEVVIAGLMVLFFLLAVVPQYALTEQDDPEPRNVLFALQQDATFRNCVLMGNESCVNASIMVALPEKFHENAQFILTEDHNEIPDDLPDSRVFVDSVFIAGNLTHYNTTIVRLFYWI